LISLLEQQKEEDAKIIKLKINALATLWFFSQRFQIFWQQFFQSIWYIFQTTLSFFRLE
jgi:hypothetical protein